MKLSRVQVTDFRKLTRVVIEDLAPGLNVVVGDNEAGKSTLLAAMRAALFERHRVTGQIVDEMLPYGRQVRPTVEIDFSMGGADYRLLKAFASRPEARLIGAGGTEWTGDEADETLSRILGFTRPGRGESKPDQHHGAFGMLWVSQGTAHHTPSIGAVREQVAGAIEREVGAVAGGEHGRSMLQRAADRQALFWDKLRRPRGDYRKAVEELAGSRAQRDAVRGRLRELEADVDRLGQITTRLEAYGAEDTLGQAKVSAEAASEAVKALAALQQRVATATDAAALAELGHRDATRDLTARQSMIEAMRQATAALERDRQAAQQAGARLDRLQATADLARDNVAMAVTAEQAARQILSRLEAAESARHLRDFVARGQLQLAAAEDLERRRLEAAAVVAAARVDAAAMQRLEKLAAAITEAQSRLDAASVRLRLRPQFGGAAEIEGTILEEAEFVVSRDTTVHLFGYGEIDVRPGGGVADLELAVQSVESALSDALSALGQPDMDLARANWEHHKAARQALPSLAQSLAALAPDGLDRLRFDLAVAVAKLDQMGDGIGEDSTDTLEEAKRKAGAGAAAAAGAREVLERASKETNDAKADLAVAKDRETNAQSFDKQARDTLVEARLVTPDDRLRELQTMVAAALERSRDDLAAANDQLRRAEPELVQLRHGKAVKALEAIVADIEQLKRNQIQLEATLQAQGREGLGEQLSLLEGEIATREALVGRLHVEARAAALLSETLVQAQRETKERWLRPIHDRAAPYLGLLQRGSEISLDEDTLDLTSVRRDDILEPFDGLSMGAREQIAVITRLALADILADAGHPTCLILDDPLVNADQHRLERMHLVLHKAAERHQIIVLTCRERDFLNLGAHLVRI